MRAGGDWLFNNLNTRVGGGRRRGKFLFALKNNRIPRFILQCGDKPRLTRAAIAKLQNYHWPGNIRELRNVIERAIIISRDGALDFDLPVTESAVVPSRHAAHAKSEVEPEFLTDAELQRRERKNLMTVLEKTHWKIKGENGAAELLGVKATTLKARIKKMGLKRPASL